MLKLANIPTGPKAIIHGALFWAGQWVWLKFNMLIAYQNTNKLVPESKHSTFQSKVIVNEIHKNL